MPPSIPLQLRITNADWSAGTRPSALSIAGAGGVDEGSRRHLEAGGAANAKPRSVPFRLHHWRELPEVSAYSASGAPEGRREQTWIGVAIVGRQRTADDVLAEPPVLVVYAL